MEAHRPLSLKYVDDGMTIEKLNFETAVRTAPGRRNKHAIRSQNIFRAVVRKAESRGMRVNTSKTKLLVMLDALSFAASASIVGEDGETVHSGQRMKILGFHMDGHPSVGAHVEALRKRFRQRYWILYHQRRYGFSESDLCKVYRTIIRPVADYCCVVYHAMLSDEQDQTLDRCQAQALRCIFGKDISYEEMRRRACVTTLRQRRIELCDKFAQKCLKNPRFLGWFPRKKAPRYTRTSEEFVEFFRAL